LKIESRCPFQARWRSRQTAQEIRNSELRPPSPSVGGASEAGQKSFADTLKDAVNNVNQMQKESDVKMQEVATGKKSQYTRSDDLG